jgi:hypothetical protein
MRHNVQSDVAEEVHNFARIPEIRRLSVAEEQQFITQVENLGGGLVKSDDHGLAFRHGVPLQRRH